MEKDEGFLYNNLLDKRKKSKPKFQINNLVRTGELRKTYSKGDTTNWSYNMYEITKIINGTLPSYRIDNLKGRYNESLLKKIILTLKEYKNVTEALNLT